MVKAPMNHDARIDIDPRERIDQAACWIVQHLTRPGDDIVYFAGRRRLAILRAGAQVSFPDPCDPQKSAIMFSPPSHCDSRESVRSWLIMATMRSGIILKMTQIDNLLIDNSKRSSDVPVDCDSVTFHVVRKQQ